MRNALLGLIFALMTLPAYAQQPPAQEWERCQGVRSGANVPAEARVGYCSQLIQSGRLSPQNLAATYLNRGRAYISYKHYDEAIADITRTISMRPSFDAYLNRGSAYERKGDRDRAISDYRAALTLDPNNVNNAYAKRGLARYGITQ